MKLEKLRSPEWLASQRRYLRSAWTLKIVFFFSCIGDRLWSYSIGFFIGGKGGLAWVGLAQLADSLIKLGTLPFVGGLLDKTGRHTGMQLVLVCNNLSIAVSSICFYLSLSSFFENETMNWAFFWTAVLINALSRVASEAQKTAFLKDWIIVIVEDFEEGELSSHNAFCTGIDQVAAFLAPIVVGTVLEFLGHPIAALIFMGWNVVSWIIEGLVLKDLYDKTPSLHTRERNTEMEPSCCNAFVGNSICVWWGQACWRPMFALSLLFFTVLGYDNILTAYGTEQNISPIVLSVFRGSGAVLGCLGVFIYSCMSNRRYSVILIGLVGLVLQNVFLNLTTVSLFLPGNQYDVKGYAQNITFSDWKESAYDSVFNPKNQTKPAGTHGIWWMISDAPSLFVFFLGVTLARLGLWIADPAVQQIMQESVPEDQRYRVGLAQNAAQEGFSFLKDVIVFIFPLASTFGALIVMSVSFVFIGFVIYASYFITEGRPIRRRPSLQAEGIEMVQRLELNVVENGVHPELQELLSNGDVEKAAPTMDDDGIEEAPLQTTRTEGL